MSDNRRRHPRYPINADVLVRHPDIGEKIVKTRNVSDGGVFLITEPTAMPAIGEIVFGQVQGMIDNPPLIKMEIVRTEFDGIGLQFIEEDI